MESSHEELATDDLTLAYIIMYYDIGGRGIV